jgi:SpoIID/LytB domain protein
MTGRLLAACGLPAIALAIATSGCAPLPPSGSPPVPPSGSAGAPRTSTRRDEGARTPPAPTPLRLDGEPSIEVGLEWDADTLDLAAAERQLTWRIGRAHDRASGRATRLWVIRAGGGTELRQDQDRKATAKLASGDTLWIGEPQDGQSLAGEQLRWKGKTWRGQAKVFVNTRSHLTLALRLPLESYLIGVVPGEIGALSDALLEAGRAQAVAARSYTLFYRGRRGEEGFDVYGSVEDQVYGPIESERPLATRCVQTTRAQIALYDGAPIRANYYSTCGGITADVWEAFPAARMPYLSSRRDSDGHEDYCARSPLYRWREEWPASDFLDIVTRFAPPEGVRLPAPPLGQLIDVRVTSRSRSARVWSLEIETTAGTIVVPAYSVRRVLRRPIDARPILRSNLFKIGVRRDPSTRRALSVVASGAGSGHGVGLCQTGALGMARAGRKGEEILEHYYPGITLSRMY